MPRISPLVAALFNNGDIQTEVKQMADEVAAGDYVLREGKKEAKGKKMSEVAKDKEYFKWLCKGFNPDSLAAKRYARETAKKGKK